MIAKFLRGFIDGSLATLGIVIGASSATSSIIIAAAIGGTVANTLSNVLSAISATGAEEYGELRSVERAMVAHDMKGTSLERAIGRRAALGGVVDGIGTLAGGILPVLPYLLHLPHPALVAVGIVTGATGVVGLYMGRITKQNLFFSAAKMVVFAGVIAVAVYFVELLIVP
jgi:predicted membrane protein (TIGR00267 family)